MLGGFSAILSLHTGDTAVVVALFRVGAFLGCHSLNIEWLNTQANYASHLNVRQPAALPGKAELD